MGVTFSTGSGFQVESRTVTIQKYQENMKEAIRGEYCLATFLFCLLMAGCGSGNDLAPVKGKVTLNGQPLEGATVEFQPTAEGGAPSAGKTDAKGRYELSYTFHTPGAMPGEHIVSIRTAETCFNGQGNEIEREERVPAKYNTRTELKRTVEPGRNKFDFEL
jgi:hypothetical protein